MTCPHCNYKNGYIEGKDGFIEGEKGSFYRLPDGLERFFKNSDNITEFKTLYACPSCGKTFINI